ncbi:putative membrane protein [Pseudomonas amygdali pv. mori]|nr:putative membrane protein [Pseudomonas amygdali pv. mori]
MRTEAQRDGQGGKHHAQRQTGFHQQNGSAGRTCRQPACEPHVDQAQRERAERGTELKVFDQRVLQAEPDDWRAKQQCAVDVITLTCRPAQQGFATGLRWRVSEFQQLATRIQQTDGQVHHKEQNQKGLRAPEQLWGVSPYAPGETDAERAEEADQVENAPGLEPGDGNDARVEQGKVTEQRDVAALPGRSKQWCCESTQRTGAGQGQSILCQRQNGRESGDCYQQHKARCRIEQGVQFHRRKDGQVQHAYACALQHQRVRTVAQTQPPTQTEQGQRAGGDCGVACFNRYDHAFGGVAQQKGQPEKQHHYAHAQYRIAAQQPVFCAIDGAVQQIGLSGL